MMTDIPKISCSLIATIILLFLCSCSDYQDTKSIKQAVRDKLLDPESVQFKAVTFNRYEDTACIIWNAKNRMGGYGEWKHAKLAESNNNKWVVVDMEISEWFIRKGYECRSVTQKEGIERVQTAKILKELGNIVGIIEQRQQGVVIPEEAKKTWCKGFEGITGFIIEQRQQGVAISDMYIIMRDLAGSDSAQETIIEQVMVPLTKNFYEIPLPELIGRKYKLMDLFFKHCMKDFNNHEEKTAIDDELIIPKTE